MIRKLRKMLVTLAAVSTILVGVRTTVAEVQPTGMAAWTVDHQRDGGCDDDSSARSEKVEEQVEEDDSAEQDGRQLHLLATSALSCSRDRCVTSVTHAPCHRAPQSPKSSALVRGPPTSL
ncbi:MAG: hypothetical protein ACR2IT_07485 [Pirellulales bacterium]